MSHPYTKEALQEFLGAEPALKPLIDRYPDDWVRSDAELKALLARGGVPAVVQAAKASGVHWERIRKSGFNPEVVRVSFPVMIRARMMTLALKNYSLAAQTKTAGAVRFDRWNAALLQGLLFQGKGFVRKPVSLVRYALTWPLVTQKSFLMPLVNKKGMYCFYSAALVRELRALVGDRTCVEVGAGDGTLSRFLNAAGVPVRATDSYGWSAFIDYPAEVEKLDARAALDRYRPAVVLSSWPDPDNGWEEAVFADRNVETYIVLGSAVPGVTGNPGTYAAQKGFAVTPRPDLARLILPREQKNAVWVFTRITSGSCPTAPERRPAG